MTEVLVASFVVMLATLGGAVSFFKFAGKLIEKNLGFLISFTAGIFLFVSYQLGKEAVQHSVNAETGLFYVMLGAVVVGIIFKFIPHSHEHSSDCCSKEDRGSAIDIRRVLTSNGIHNVGDGVLLATAFSVDFSLGVVTTISVFVHEFAQETSIFFVLRKAGYSIKKALLTNFLVSTTILIGSVGGVLLLSSFAVLEALLLGISAGAFLLVVLQDLVPHSLNESKRNNSLFLHISFFAVGVLLMFLLSLLFPHSHEYHEQEPHHHEGLHEDHSH